MHDVKVCKCTGQGPQLVYLDGASDPYRVTYFDEDWRAMAETNWDAILSELSAILDEDDEDPRYIVPREEYGLSEAQWLALTPPIGRDHSTSSYDDCAGCVHVRADDEDAVELLQDIAGRLDSYPLLDEEAYSAREFDAWCEWWEADGFTDFLADVLDISYSDAADLVDELSEDLAADLSYRVQQGMGYYSGFSGEYDTAGAEDALTAWTREVRWLAAEDARTMGGAQLVLVDIAPVLS